MRLVSPAPALLALALVAACASAPEKSSGPVQVYEVAGVITRLPAGPGTELMISHDEIPEFVNSEGNVIGMRAMTMGFPTDAGLDLSKFAPGDSVGFRFEVRWGQPDPLRITALEKR
jgi:Cu/Ag efflux protein CusF